jgi:hypothetical protein
MKLKCRNNEAEFLVRIVLVSKLQLTSKTSLSCSMKCNRNRHFNLISITMKYISESMHVGLQTIDYREASGVIIPLKHEVHLNSIYQFGKRTSR